MYFSKLRSKQSDYCNAVLAGLPASQLNQLQSVLHAAARLIHCVHRHDHVTPLQQQLQWLSVPERVIFKLCIIFSWSQPCLLIGGLQARVRDSLSPATAFGLQCRRCSSCHTLVFTWRPRIPCCRSSSIERVTAQCHLRIISVRIPGTSAYISVPATTTSITLITLCRGPEMFALSTTLILA